MLICFFFVQDPKKKTNSVFFRPYSNKRACKLETFFFRQSVAVFAHIKISILSCCFFSHFQKRILINFDSSNVRELFGIARTQTNLNKMKGKSDGKRRTSCAIWLKKAQIMKETEIDPQISFWQALNKYSGFAHFVYLPGPAASFLWRMQRNAEAAHCTHGHSVVISSL